FEQFLWEILGGHAGHDGSSWPRVLAASYTGKRAALFNLSRVFRELAGAKAVCSHAFACEIPASTGSAFDRASPYAAGCSTYPAAAYRIMKINFMLASCGPFSIDAFRFLSQLKENKLLKSGTGSA
ncbi:hypothetical protein ACE04B_38925, partial [Rhizobium phaseoli]